jgi:hypothetical protein
VTNAGGNPVRITDALTEIRTKYLPNTSLDHSLYADQLCKLLVKRSEKSPKSVGASEEDGLRQKWEDN